MAHRPNMACHLFLYACKLKMVFISPPAPVVGKEIEEEKCFVMCENHEIQISEPINKALLEHIHAYQFLVL